MPAVDLHVHSSHSDRPYSWFLRSGKSAECYTAVDEAYALAKRRGMDLVTLADHDTIAGSLELCARHPRDTFVSVEVSARFPEDGNIVHVIAIDINEAMHAELQRLRRNIYELASYIEQEQVAHFWCHPLSQVNGRLKREHLEKCFMMFRAIEVRNGTRDVTHERRLHSITRRLTGAILEDWASDHLDTPFINRDARWAYVGGSDDHGTLAIARAYTRFAGKPTVSALRAALRAGDTEPGGEAGTGTTLAHNCYGVLAGFMGENDRDLVGGADTRAGELLGALLDRRASITTAAPDMLWDGGHTTIVQETMRSRVEPALVQHWRGVYETLFAHLKNGKLGQAADVLPGLLKTLTLELPYILAYRYHVRDRRGANHFANELGENLPSQPPRVAVFTDTIDDVNGLGIGLRRLLSEARSRNHELHVVAPGSSSQLTIDANGIVRIPSLYEHRLAEYPEMAWSIPHLPPILRFLTEQSIDIIQCSTPGPVGVAALIAGRILGIKVIGQYHTDVPEYALRLTGDPAAAALVRQLVGLFYRSLDHVLVPSVRTRDIVLSLGVDAASITRVRRGIELSKFSPQRRSADAFARFGIGDSPVILYVGRVSKEKGIDRLIAAYRTVSRAIPAARLLIVGDGPQRAELTETAPEGVVFAGQITGDALAELYASARLFAFASETETFGNVVLEAQASGLPVVVGAGTAPHELMRDGVTGFAIDLQNELAGAITCLLTDEKLRTRMSHLAVQHAGHYDMQSALDDTLALYAAVAGSGERTGRVRDLVA